MKELILEWVKDIIIALIIALVIVQFVKPTIVKERSMEPNFHSNDYLFISKMAYKFGHEPARGDVVVFRSDLTTETGKKKLLIKRVIGLPGDRIRIFGGNVYINGEVYPEDYTMTGRTEGEMPEITVPADRLFCMGDNREVSIDSRDEDVGCVEQSRLVGQVVFRLFPFNQIGVIRNPNES